MVLYDSLMSLVMGNHPCEMNFLWRAEHYISEPKDKTLQIYQNNKNHPREGTLGKGVVLCGS